MSSASGAEPDGSAVLVVEDDELVRIDSCDLLERAGLRVLEAANADEAMALLETHPEVRVLVTDVKMPGWMSGIDLARQAAKKWPDMCIMVTSAYYTSDEGELPDNMTIFPKPFSPDALVKEVKLRMRR